MDRFDAMQAFARVVDTGSFTKAAETLHMSRTSVTQLVQQLEARLRVRLLNRTTRKLNLTADGAAVASAALKQGRRRILENPGVMVSGQGSIYAPRL